MLVRTDPHPMPLLLSSAQSEFDIEVEDVRLATLQLPHLELGLGPGRAADAARLQDRCPSAVQPLAEELVESGLWGSCRFSAKRISSAQRIQEWERHTLGRSNEVPFLRRRSILSSGLPKPSGSGVVASNGRYG